MEQLLNFLDFNAYGQFIWGAYGLTALVLIGILVQSLRFQARIDAELAALKGTPEAENGEGEGHETQA